MGKTALERHLLLQAKGMNERAMAMAAAKEAGEEGRAVRLAIAGFACKLLCPFSVTIVSFLCHRKVHYCDTKMPLRRHYCDTVMRPSPTLCARRRASKRSPETAQYWTRYWTRYQSTAHYWTRQPSPSGRALLCLHRGLRGSRRCIPRSPTPTPSGQGC